MRAFNAAWCRLNSRSVPLTAVAGLLVQVGRPVVALLTLPLLLAHVGQEGLGLWMIALSLMGLVSVISAGLSVSVITAVGRSSGSTAALRIERLTTAATLLAAIGGLVVLVVAVPVAIVVDWRSLLGIENSETGAEVCKLMVALAALLSFGLLIGVPRQVMIGRMHGYLAHVLDFGGVVIGAVMLAIGLWSGWSLWLLGVAYLAPSFLIVFLGGLVYMRRERIPLFSWRCLDFAAFKGLARDSLKMAGYQSAYAISSQSDLFLIALFLGAPASATYGIAQRVFALPIMIAAGVNHAQWPAMARADASGDHATVGRMLRYTLAIGSGAAAAVAIFLGLAYQPLLDVWLGHPLATDPEIVLGMVTWVVVATLVNTCDSVLRARNETALLMYAMLAMAVINIGTTLLLLPFLGAAGAIWGTITGYSVALLAPYAVRLNSLLVGPKRSMHEDADVN